MKYEDIPRTFENNLLTISFNLKEFKTILN
jgi:hypothetical protein